MEHFQASPAMLLDCADMVLRLSGGADVPCDVPCVRYNMLASCEIVRFLAEDVSLDRDAAGRTVVPLPGIDEASVRITVDLLHGISAAADLSRDDAKRALRGMDVLGSRLLVPLVHARLWHWIQHDALAEVLPYVPRLAAEPGVQLPLLRRLVAMRPQWADFKAEVLDRLPMDFELARVVLSHLVRFFPASTALAAVVDKLQHPTADKILALCGEHGSYYHPGEVRDVMTLVDRALDADSPTRALARTMLGALGTYRTLPLAAAKVHGTVLLFEVPTVSVLLTFDTDSTRPIFVRATNWLRVNVDRESGTMDISFVLGRFDEDGARNVQLRVLCWTEDTECGGSDVSSEVWYEFTDVEAVGWTSLSQAAATSEHQGQVAALQEPRRMRLDFFYDTRHSALDRPF
jgi:hypothetical protein